MSNGLTSVGILDKIASLFDGVAKVEKEHELRYRKLLTIQREGGDFICWPLPESGARLVMFSSGLGDGVYSAYSSAKQARPASTPKKLNTPGLPKSSG